jgi:hypothetical protein
MQRTPPLQAEAHGRYARFQIHTISRCHGPRAYSLSVAHLLR